MEEKRKNSFIASLLIGPTLALGGIFALWENEGRFDYAKAAAQALPVESISAVPADTTVSLTAQLDTEIPIAGEYIESFAGYHVVYRRAEIYSWEKRQDDNSTRWELEWNSSVENNSRNGSIRQDLRSTTLYPPEYRLGSLTIDRMNIHFVDGRSPVSHDNLPLTEEAKRLKLERRGDYLYQPHGSGQGPQLGDERVSYRGIVNTPTATYFGLIGNGVGTAKQFEVSQGFISGIIGNDGIHHG